MRPKLAVDNGATVGKSVESRYTVAPASAKPAVLAIVCLADLPVSARARFFRLRALLLTNWAPVPWLAAQWLHQLPYNGHTHFCHTLPHDYGVSIDGRVSGEEMFPSR